MKVYNILVVKDGGVHNWSEVVFEDDWIDVDARIRHRHPNYSYAEARDENGDVIYQSVNAEFTEIKY